MRRRHQQYRANGSHLLKQFSEALEEGYVVLRRVKYTKSTEKAKALEERPKEKEKVLATSRAKARTKEKAMEKGSRVNASVAGR